jgi:ribonuclease VapC
MILDSSAIIAIVFREPGYETVLDKLTSAAEVGVGYPTLVECSIVVSARLNRDARGLLTRFLKEAEVTTVPFSEAHYEAAVGAWLRYGKGRDPASLNFGDCLSYATAKIAAMPLLCTGNDFPQTDLPLA